MLICFRSYTVYGTAPEQAKVKVRYEICKVEKGDSSGIFLTL